MPTAQLANIVAFCHLFKTDTAWLVHEGGAATATLHITLLAKHDIQLDDLHNLVDPATVSADIQGRSTPCPHDIKDKKRSK
mmetsp:Transcript_40191/g.92387  ORF Transcript_40191/g.92387 Transcript_40191/m.92387 type:complete len:81 (+) Transcript_40191:411-653(+)